MIHIQNGIINVNKPAEWTSFDCVTVARKCLGIKRIGHTGTLDPMATGVLPICIGNSTRIMEYLDLDYKTYQCEMTLGVRTDTLDIWGKVLGEEDTYSVTQAAIEAAFESFQGFIKQIPPKYSALKVDGRKLYQYAREGKDVEIKPREVFIKELSVDRINLLEKQVSFTVTCSKGTYIRSICRDVGEFLGCGAAMSGLTRTASGIFSIDDAIGIESLKNMESEEIVKLVKSTDYPLVHFGKSIMNEEQATRFCNGGQISLSEIREVCEPEFKDKDAEIRIKPEFRNAYNMYSENGSSEMFLGVAFYNSKSNQLKADKVFSRGK